MSEITDRQLNAKPTGKDIWLTESAPKGQGRFVARITKKGERIFYFRYTNSTGKREYITIGNYSKTGTTGLTLKEARVKAREYADLYISGVTDLKPHLEEKQKSSHLQMVQENRQRELEEHILNSRQTFRDIFLQFHKIETSKHKDGGKEVERIFNKDILPFIGDKAIDEVSKAEIMEIIDQLSERNLKFHPKKVFSLIRQMYRFALERDKVTVDPTASIRKSKIGEEEEERTRVLSEDEILELKNRLDKKTLEPINALSGQKIKMSKPLKKEYQLAIFISLGTLCRGGELSQSEWSYINFDKKTWLIPEDLSKNTKPLTIYLSDFVFKHFKELYALTGHSKWCFPSSKKDTPIDRKVINKQITDRQVQFSNRDINKMKGRVNNNDLVLAEGLNGNWTFHDLRRTGATLMEGLGVYPEVIDRCQNHAPHKGHKIRRHYLHHKYTEEMRNAWTKLGEKLEEILSK